MSSKNGREFRAARRGLHGLWRRIRETFPGSRRDPCATPPEDAIAEFNEEYLTRIEADYRRIVDSFRGEPFNWEVLKGKEYLAEYLISTLARDLDEELPKCRADENLSDAGRAVQGGIGEFAEACIRELFCRVATMEAVHAALSGNGEPRVPWLGNRLSEEQRSMLAGMLNAVVRNAMNDDAKCVARVILFAEENPQSAFDALRATVERERLDTWEKAPSAIIDIIDRRVTKAANDVERKGYSRRFGGLVKEHRTELQPLNEEIKERTAGMKNQAVILHWLATGEKPSPNEFGSSLESLYRWLDRDDNGKYLMGHIMIRCLDPGNTVEGLARQYKGAEFMAELVSTDVWRNMKLYLEGDSTDDPFRILFYLRKKYDDAPGTSGRAALAGE